MTPTLDDGDILLVRAVLKPVARGTVVIADVPGLESNIQVKRLVGLPCDRIVFEDSTLFINGAIHSEPYLSGLPHTVGFCLLYTSPSPRDRTRSRMPSSA